jgi:ferredoxin
VVTERIHVVVDKSRCIGSGQCLYAEPIVFDQDEDDGIVILLEEFPDSSLLDNVRQAARTCPGQAIRISLDGTEGGSA